MIEIKRNNNTVFMQAGGELDDKDYDKMLSVLREMLETYDEVNWYLEFNDFEGWTTHAFWRDISFTLSNRFQFHKVAIVGENQWQEAMVEVMQLFSVTHIAYFKEEEAGKAKKWVRN